MILSFSLQLNVFLTAFLTGLALGFVYDLIRISRRIIKRSLLWVQIEDGLYWIGAAIASFMIMLDHFNGEVRPFVLIGTGLGMALYFSLPSIVIMRLAHTVISHISSHFKQIIRPVKKRCAVLVYPVKKLKIFLSKRAKKFLHLCKVYAKLKMRHFVKELKSVTKK